ncbi:bifunctional folylpolyglutamate synthase/dihydrofolate synthase [Luteolibacter sp. SL250]|uniref:bifunctional folylpolyglutamate synthase/dihydrofolate synthase n=1 Tax=Luteolibacter sp. SL250 TaxID=2995170 RepID=UPI00226FB468|nr:folylpolyglutamate synthase/dihydrofolate synthase family protein [Luteolibacter sp. SL250]WAC19948.1 bifunctional folylpolyglutamate synthase/dihydrofolate synthase [Luteolibacter sp. SL250]
MNYVESIAWLFSTQMFGIKLGLEGPRRLLKEYLAHPAHGVTVIHVAGTNGKGSTCAMIDSIARSSGKRTGLFTSPHLIDYRERIKVSGVDIPEEACADMLTELRGLCERLETHPTFFEITLALAMRWFRERECEVIILETGMGGRLDATTAVQADIAVITPIGLDHTQWLGDTLELVAAEKAGIFVPGKPAVSSPQDPAARRVLEVEANESRSPLEFVTEPLLGYGVALPGEHQKWNAALAVAALFKCGLPLNSDIIRHGLASVRWPGRFERFEVDGRAVILDGAHNPHAARVLVETWDAEFPDQKAALVFSAVSSKDIAGILAPIAPLASEIFICPVDTPRATPVEEIAAALPEGASPHRLFPDFPSAFAAAKESGPTVLVAGSLFLVGDARAVLTGGTFQGCTQ